MGTKIGAAVSTLVALALLGLAVTSPASAISQPRIPAIGWAEELTGPRALPAHAAAAASSPANASATAQPGVPEPANPAAVAEPLAQPKPAVAEPEPAVVAPKLANAEPAAAPKAEPKPVAAEPAPKVEPKPAVAAPADRPEPVPALVRPQPADEPKAVAAAAKPKPAVEPKAPAEPQGIGTLSVSSTPEGVEVHLDGANIGQTPIEIDVPTGPHRLKFVETATGTEQKKTVNVELGKVSKVEISF